MLPTITTITPTTTKNQFVKLAYPMQCAAIRALSDKPAAFGALGAKQAALAVWANQIVNAEGLFGLSQSIAKETMRLMSLRALKKELAILEDKGDAQSQSRAVVIDSVLTKGLRAQLQQLALLCLNGKTENYSQEETAYLLKACEAFVLDKYPSLSLDEIEAAFLDAAANGINAYGAFNVKLLGEVLGAYKTRRDFALNAVLDKIAQDAKNINLLETVAAKNSDAYIAAVEELRALQVRNTTHQTFHTCPHHNAKRFLEEGVFELSAEDKKILWAEANAQLAYDLLNDAPTLNARKALQAYLEQIKVVPVPSGRKVRSDVFKANLSPAFEYSEPAKHFKEFAQNYYAKKMYFCNIQIFE